MRKKQRMVCTIVYNIDALDSAAEADIADATAGTHV